MAELHVNIGGDCSGLIAATDRASSAIDALAGKTAVARVELVGADAAVSGLGRVGELRENAGGVVRLGVDDGGSIAGARSDLGGLRNDVRAASREFEAAGGVRTFGVADNGSVRQLTADLGGATRATTALASEGGQIDRVSTGIRSTSGAARQLDVDLGGAARSATGLTGGVGAVERNVAELGRSATTMGAQVSAALDSSAGSLRDTAGASGQVTSQLREMAMAGGGAGGGMDATAARATAMTGTLSGGGGLSSALSGNSSDFAAWGDEVSKSGSVWEAFKQGGREGLPDVFQRGPGMLNAFREGVATELGGTVAGTRDFGGSPPIDHGGGGRGGGGGGGGDGGGDEGRGGFLKGTSRLQHAIGEFDAVGTLGMPVMMGAAIGLAEGAGVAAVGMMAVNAVVKATPALSYAAGQAQEQMARGVRAGAEGATAVGVPAYQKLGAALRGLGQEMGQVGAANIGTLIGGEATLATGATTALKALAPAIGPAIQGFTDLGSAVLQGISSPGVAQSINSLSTVLQSPQVEQGISSLVGFVAKVAPVVAAVATRVVGAVGNDFGGGPSSPPSGVGTGIWSQPVGETVAEHSGGLFSYDPKTDTGDKGGSVPLPGLGFGEHWNQNTQFGRGMTLGGSALTSGLGYVATSVGDMIDGSTLHGQPTPQRDAFGKEFSGRLSDTLTSKPGAPDVGASAPEQLAAAQTAAPHGWDKGPGGSLTPSAGPAGGGGWWPGGPGTGGSGVQSVQPPGLGQPPPKPVTTAPTGGGAGAGSSFGSLNPAQVAGLNAALPSLSSNLTRTGASAQQLSSGLAQAPAATQHLSTGLQQVASQSQAMAAPMQQAAAHTQAATTAVSQLAAQAPAATQAVAQIAPVASKALGEAAPQVASAGQSLGGVATTAIASGMTANQSQACDASSQLAKSTQNCAANVLGAHSPSERFKDLGLGTGQGLALGITASTPIAVNAVKAAMGDVVAAGQAGLAAASPSKEFQAMGSQAMANVATGATSAAPSAAGTAEQQRSEEQQRTAALQRENASHMPQKLMSDAEKKAQEQAQKDASAQGLSPDAKDDAAYKRMLQGRGLSPATQDRLMAEHGARRDQDKKRQTEKDTQQRTAMERLGWKGYDPANPKSPHNQRKDQLESDRDTLHTDARGKVDSRDNTFRAGDDPFKHTGGSKDDAFLAAKARGELGLEAVRTGRTPQQILNDKTNAALGAGPDTGGDKTGGGLGKGIDKGSPGAANASGNAVDGAINEAKKKAKAHSPSQVFFDLGGDLMLGLSNGINAGGGAVAASVSDTMSGALGSGVTVASNGVLGIASNTGLQVGYQWARGVASGADSVLKSADFSQLSLPQIGSALAKTALGAGGMLGPAGSGGSIPNHLTVTMGAGTPAAPPIVNTYVSIDGTQLRAMTRTEIESVLSALADSIPQQVG